MALDIAALNATLYSNYTVDEMRDMVASEAAKLSKSNEREPNVLRELINDKHALEKAMELDAAGDPIDPSTGYDNFEEWIDHLSKQIRTSEKSLAGIDLNKVIVIALEYFVENAS